MGLLMKIGILFLNIVYFFYKFFPDKNQIAFISRQSNEISVDYFLLKEELKKKAPQIAVVEMYKMIPQTILGKIKYVFYILGPQMYVLATSKVAILDGYSIAVSVLKHKKELKIVQMWHAMGSLKCFGYAAIGTEEGSERKTAEYFKMHKNYDYILASSKVCIRPLSEAFGNPVEKFVVMPLPRTDLITDYVYSEQKRNQILKQYPEIEVKKNILYAPTFRKKSDMLEAVEQLIQVVDYEKYNLIVKLHPLVQKHLDSSQVLPMEEYDSWELLSIADYVVTDYSAFIFEAALANLPIIFYTFDYDEYKNKRGFLIDYEKEIPGKMCRTAEEVIGEIENDEVDIRRISAFAYKYVDSGNRCTEKLARFLIELCQG